ncbi:MAG: PSD1 and planctomycete cytochrome C domain-containing protein [Planctomycetaceae bacterium]
MIPKLHFSPWTWCVIASSLYLRSSHGYADEAAAVDFEKDVAPILFRNCLECHQVRNSSGGLALDTASGIAAGGESGAAVARYSAANSLIMQRVRGREMPPPQHGETRALAASDVEILRQWIDAGAVFPEDRRLDIYERTTDVRGGRDWWSFQPLRHIDPPWSTMVPAGSNPIDAFIQVALQEQGLTSAPPAAPAQLVRRLYWTTTGLPASEAQIAAFTSNPSDQATGRLVNDLLASPHFGERWARHWLDVVRFAETSGYERDQTKPFAWKYRDWVVNAFNSDMPYDEFIQDQLAGDQIHHRSESSVIATGFLRLGTWNDEPNDPEDYKYERLEDLVHATSSAFLGMTTKCARCHDHKFDPVPQEDYYRIAASFWSGPVSPGAGDLLGGPSAEALGYPEVLGWTDVTTSPQPLHVLKNGDRHHPMQAVTAGVLTCVPGQQSEMVSNASANEVKATGARLQLADWITSPENPLTARVIVNRLWQHHFGQGLVRSSNNFGFTGERPTHPELLDWLAAELIYNNWSLKHIHRLILTSATWQQSSLHPEYEAYVQQDSANRFLWRANRRRLEAEAVRDAFLAASGELDPRIGGPGFFPTISAEALEGLSRKASAWTASPENEQLRRSLYIFTQRSLLPPMMTAFDMCDTTLPCGQRDVTIVAPQALTLLNNEFIHRRAGSLAERVSLSCPDAVDGQIDAVWRAVLNRQPSAVEMRMAAEHIQRQLERFQLPDSENSTRTQTPNELALASLCLVLFNSNEFIYAD